MKIVSKKISIIVVFHFDDGTPKPYKFKVKDENGENAEVLVEKILEVKQSKIAGKDSIIYCCQSTFGNVEKRYELKYIVPECRWVLYKI